MEEIDEKKVLHRVKRGDPTVSLSDILSMIEEFQKENPEMDVFWDGDEYAICARKKRKMVQDRLF